MKFILQTTILCLIFTALIFPQPWQLQSATLPSDAIAAPFSPVDDNIVWASWSTGWPGGPNFFNGYLRTTNGGTTWVCDTIPETQNGMIWWLDALDANTAFIAVESWASSGMQGIYKTTDGGATWQKHPTVFTGSTYGPGYVHFFDNNNGVAVGERNPDYFEIYTTTNGGTDWNLVPVTNMPPANTGEWLNPVEVGEYGDCIWLPTEGYPASIPRFLKTTDKGYNWTAIDPGFTLDYFAFPAFQNNSIGMVVGWSLNAAEYSLKKTLDGGDTWTAISEPYGGCVPLNVSYVPGTPAGYVITGDINVNGYAGSSAFTLDGGNTWINLDNGNYCYMIFNSDQSGWATCWTTNNFYKYVGPPMPIPVELTSFTASVSGNVVNLNWITSTETNNKGFEVERSQKPAFGEVSLKSGSKGKSQKEWEKVGFVEGKGTTTDEQQYSFTDKNVPSGNYTYRLKQIDLNGSASYSEEINVEVISAFTYYLNQNYPNPFNPTTTIKFGLKEKSNVRIDIFNSIGETVRTILNEERDPGSYAVDFNAVDLPSGVYIYRIESGNFVQTRKMMLLK